MDHYCLENSIKCDGYSGCHVEIFENCIIKSSSDSQYNSRLLAQSLKQSSHKSKYLLSPKILGNYYVDDILRVKMEYINGVNFARLFEITDIYELDDIFKLFIDYIVDNLNKSTMVNVTDDIISKIDSVKRNVPDNVKDVVPYVSEEIIIPVGVCHGDLTLSNTLYNSNGIYVFDFLDCFVESPIQDIVKLRQDTFHYWSLKRCDGFDISKIKIILSHFDEVMVNTFGKYGWFNFYELFQKLNLCRVLQYAKSPKDIMFLIEEIKKVENG